jgi:hypothetical protein
MEGSMEGIEVVESSTLFRELATAHPGVEAWPDEGFTEGDWSLITPVGRLSRFVRPRLAPPLHLHGA